MKNHALIPLVMLATLTTLTACTQSPTPNHIVTPPAPTTLTASTHPTPSSTSVTKTEVVSYMSPAGKDQIEFSITVESGMIMAASAKPLATNDASKYNQGNFIKEVATKVVGKSIQDFKVDTIGGASLTTAAFEKFVQSV